MYLNHMANVLTHNLNSWLNDNELHLSIEKPAIQSLHPVKIRLITNSMLK
jgi:hypothetical protein